MARENDFCESNNTFNDSHQFRSESKVKQDAEGIQNMPGLYLIGLIFMRWKQL